MSGYFCVCFFEALIGRTRQNVNAKEGEEEEERFAINVIPTEAKIGLDVSVDMPYKLLLLEIIVFFF